MIQKKEVFVMLKKLASAKRSTYIMLFGPSGLWLRRFVKRQYRRELNRSLYKELTRTAYTQKQYGMPIIDTTYTILSSEEES